MSKHSIFQYDRYLPYLKTHIATSQTRGVRSRLARAAGCSPSYLSQVLGGQADLTLDQATGLAKYWLLGRDETAYLLDLVSLARAGTPALKEILAQRLAEARERSSNLATHITSPVVGEEERASVYYGEWQMVALHILVSIPSLQTVSALSQRLQIPAGLIEQSLHELERIGIVTREKGRWRPQSGSVHLPRRSPFLLHHLANWRLRALHSYAQYDDRNLHYAGVHSMSQKDAEHMRAAFVDTLHKMQSTVKESREEDALCLNLDFFRV